MCDLADDQRGLVGHGLRRHDGRVDGRHVVGVDRLHVPAIRLEAQRHVVAVRKRGRAIDADVVVVVEIDQLAQLEVAGQRGRLVADAFFQVAVADE